MTQLTFSRDHSYLGKTEVWHIYSNNQKETLLGVIKWYSSWRQYVLEPEPDCIWSWDCLKEVSDFIKCLMDMRKQKGEKG